MPEVLGIFKIIIDYVWAIWTYPIALGNGHVIQMWWIYTFGILMGVLLKFLVLDNTFRADASGKYSTNRQRRVKNDRLNRNTRNSH